MRCRRFRSRPRFRRGVTFIETLVAVLILAVGLMALMNAWLFSFHVTRRTDEVGTAYSLARAAVEQLRGMGYYAADPRAIPRYYSTSATATTAAVTDESPPYYQLDAALTTGTDTANPQQSLREIEIVVSRVSDGGELCRVQTYLTVGGI